MSARVWKSSCAEAIKTTDLLEVKDIVVKTGGTCDHAACGGNATSTIFDLAKKIQKDRQGWILNLKAGERVLREVTLSSGILLVPSYTPVKSDICLTTGSSVLYALYYETGTAYATSKNSLGGALGFVKDANKKDTDVVAKSRDMGEGILSKPAINVDDDGGKFFAGDGLGGITVQSIDIQPVPQGSKIFREGTD
jgi:type IV pilus assembly protein PilY1